jgi:hypothetical protein
MRAMVFVLLSAISVVADAQTVMQQASGKANLFYAPFRDMTLLLELQSPVAWIAEGQENRQPDWTYIVLCRDGKQVLNEKGRAVTIESGSLRIHGESPVPAKISGDSGNIDYDDESFLCFFHSEGMASIKIMIGDHAFICNFPVKNSGAVVGETTKASMVAKAGAEVSKEVHSITWPSISVHDGVVYTPSKDRPIRTEHIRYRDFPGAGFCYSNGDTLTNVSSVQPYDHNPNGLCGVVLSNAARASTSSVIPDESRLPSNESAMNAAVDEIAIKFLQMNPVLPKLYAWKAGKGKQQIKAEFVSLDEDILTIKRKDGKLVRVPISRLSEESQALAKQLESEK